VIQWLRAFDAPVAICTHGHFGRALGARWIGLPIIDAGRLLLSTASVSILDFEHGQRDRPAVLLWNEAAPADSGW
jgi:probable phosphoglycerate mutase